jgi:hypothetical protein
MGDCCKKIGGIRGLGLNAASFYSFVSKRCPYSELVQIVTGLYVIA